MQLYGTHAGRSLNAARWLAVLIAFAITTALAVPMSSVSAQTPAPSSPGSGVIDIVPESAYIFAQASLDDQSDQFQLAMELAERAGLGSTLEEEGLNTTTGMIPANAQIGIVVTSFPETSDLEITNVAADPTGTTESLDDGGYALIISADEVESLFQSQLEDLQAGGDVTETEYGGVTITSSAGDELTDPTAIAMVGGFGVMAMYAEDIHPLIDAFNGDVPGLAASQQYRELTGLLPAENLANGFVNGPAISAEAMQMAPDLVSMAGQGSLDMLDAWTAFALSAEQQGLRFETRSMSNSEPFEDVTPLDGSFLESVPSDALFVANGADIDGTGILTSLAYLFASGMAGQDPFATPVAGMATPTQDEVFTQAESMLGFNIKTDFVDQLVGEFGIAVSVDSITDPSGIPAVDALVVSDVDNVVAVTDALSKVSFIAGAAMGDQTSIDTREVNGSSVSVIDLSQMDAGVDRVEYGVVDNEFVLSVGSGLDDYLLGPESPLASDPDFMEVMEYLPEDYGSVSYVNLPVVLDLVTSITDTMGAGMEDADASCGEFASQEEAQAAYDEDQFENFMLDQDFDGEACEDYFATGEATPEVAANPYSNVKGLASVTTQENGIYGTTTFLLIADE